MGTRIEIETEITLKVRLSGTVEAPEPEVGLGTTIEDLTIEEIIGVEQATEMRRFDGAKDAGHYRKLPFHVYRWSDPAVLQAVGDQTEDLFVQAYGDSEGR